MIRVLSVLCLTVTSLCHAQGFVERIEPPVWQQGKTTRVTLVGSGFGKALDLWTSLPLHAIKATPIESSATRAVLDVVVDKGAPVGVAGLRLASVDGLANAALFLIDDLPVRPAAGKVELPASLWSRFREGEVDRYAIEVKAGQSVSFEIVGNRLGKDVDPLLTIRDAQGKFVAERDNDAGLYFDFRFEHTFAKAGTYYVEVRDARFMGSEHGLYVLRMGKFPAARVAVPVSMDEKVLVQLPELNNVPVTVVDGAGGIRRKEDEGSSWIPLDRTHFGTVTQHEAPGNTMDTATLIKFPGAAYGVLRKPGDVHHYRLEMLKGQKLTVRAEARSLNSPADLELATVDATGKETRRVTENPQEEITLDITANKDGIYGLRVRDVNRDGGPAHIYRLDVSAPLARVKAFAEVEALSIPKGSYQPIPITVTRSDYSGPVTLTLENAPRWLTLTPTEIPEGVNSVVCKLSALNDAPLGLSSPKIIAHVSTDGKNSYAAFVLTKPLIDRLTVNVDLIVHALREDQRRLPPSLTDRFAVQVTPASPFTMELPEPQLTLARYQHVEYPIVIDRVADFKGPITFSAKGGQIAPKEEGRTRVYAEFGEAKGSIHSKILTNLTKHRVEVTGVGVVGERKIALTRTFELDVRSAFTVTPEPAKVTLNPRISTKVLLKVDRLKTFDGDVEVLFNFTPGMTYPEKVVIPRGQTSVEMEIGVPLDRMPGRVNLNFTSSGLVSGFEEELRGGRIEVDVPKPAPPPKPAKK